MEKYKLNGIYKEFTSRCEKSVLEFNGTALTVKLLKQNPRQEFIDAINNTTPFFQIYSKDRMLFLLIKFSGIDWIDIPFYTNTYNNTLPIIDVSSDENYGYSCRILFADSKNGKLITDNTYTLSHGLSKAFYYAVKEILKHPVKNQISKINSIRASFNAREMAQLSLGR